MCIMTHLVISAICYLGKSFNNEDDTKLSYILSYFCRNFFDIDVIFLPEASFGLRVLSLPASVRPSVSPSVRPSPSLSAR